MCTQLIGAAFNILLNYVFIFIFGWGMKGSAFATILAQLISASWVLGYYITGRSLVKIRLVNLRPRWAILSGIMAIGFAQFAMQMAASVQQVILNNTLVARRGYGIISHRNSDEHRHPLFMPILGVAQGAQPIIGYNYGARQYKGGRHLETGCNGRNRYCIDRVPDIAYLARANSRAVQRRRLAAYCPDNHAMLVYLALIPIVGFQIVSSTYFQAVGKARPAAVLSLSRQILFFIPLLLILPRFWGIEGVWRAAPIADILAVSLSATMMFLKCAI